MEKKDFSDPNQREIHSASPSSSDKEERSVREGLTWTDDEEKKIRRKLDFRVVLWLLCYTCCVFWTELTSVCTLPHCTVEANN